jgi:hypothetical protein
MIDSTTYAALVLVWAVPDATHAVESTVMKAGLPS